MKLVKYAKHHVITQEQLSESAMAVFECACREFVGYRGQYQDRGLESRIYNAIGVSLKKVDAGLLARENQADIALDAFERLLREAVSVIEPVWHTSGLLIGASRSST
jgi:hypothetical protein